MADRFPSIEDLDAGMLRPAIAITINLIWWQGTQKYALSLLGATSSNENEKCSETTQTSSLPTTHQHRPRERE